MYKKIRQRIRHFLLEQRETGKSPGGCFASTSGHSKHEEKGIKVFMIEEAYVGGNFQTLHQEPIVGRNMVTRQLGYCHEMPSFTV